MSYTDEMPQVGTPFPHRHSKGNVYYPYKGKGWYHAEEVRAAIEMYGREAVVIVGGWAFGRECKHVLYRGHRLPFISPMGREHTRAVDFAAVLGAECPNDLDEISGNRLTSIKDAVGYVLTKFPSGWFGRTAAACLLKVRDERHSNVRLGPGMRS